ncbi:MAG: MarC family protein [bacterium]
MIEFFQKLAYYLVTMFVIIDPVGIIPIFISITVGVSRRFKKMLARKAVMFSIGIVIIFFIFGDSLLKFLGIDLNAFKVAGGIVLFILAMEMLFASEKPTKMTPQEREEIREQMLEEQGVWIVPLSIPALTGPVTMSSIIIFTSQEKDILMKLTIPIACIICLVISYYLMIFADKIINRFGNAGINAVSRIMGIVLLSIAIKICVSGVKELWN